MALSAPVILYGNSRTGLFSKLGQIKQKLLRRS